MQQYLEAQNTATDPATPNSHNKEQEDITSIISSNLQKKLKEILISLKKKYITLEKMLSNGSTFQYFKTII